MTKRIKAMFGHEEIDQVNAVMNDLHVMVNSGSSAF